MPRFVGRHLAVLLVAAFATAGWHRLYQAYNIQNRTFPAMAQRPPALEKVSDAIAGALIAVQRLEPEIDGPLARAAV